MNGLAKSLLYTLTMLCILGILLTSCDKNEDKPLPTVAEIDFEQYQTALVFTINAPPPGFNEISFPEIDDNIITIPHSRFEIVVSFEGHDSNSGQAVTGSMQLIAWNDELNAARQIKIDFQNDIFSGGSSNLDIVRLSNSYYMLDANKICTTDPAVVAEIANIRAGQLIGGIEFAQPTGRKEFKNGVQAWQYGFDPQYLNKPEVRLATETSELDVLTGEVWVDPELNIVVSFTVEMNVHRATLLFGTREVTGRLRYQYNVFDLGIQPNISIPNGC